MLCIITFLFHKRVLHATVNIYLFGFLFVSPAVSRGDTKGSLLRRLSVSLSVCLSCLSHFSPSHFEITQVLLILLIFLVIPLGQFSEMAVNVLK